jgi:hypothetical protein
MTQPATALVFRAVDVATLGWLDLGPDLGGDLGPSSIPCGNTSGGAGRQAFNNVKNQSRMLQRCRNSPSFPPTSASFSFRHSRRWEQPSLKKMWRERRRGEATRCQGRRSRLGVSEELGLTSDVHPSRPVITCGRVGTESQGWIPFRRRYQSQAGTAERIVLAAGLPCNGRIGRLTVNQGRCTSAGDLG